MSIGDKVYFVRLSVKPSLMGKGLGKKIIYLMAKYLKDKGYKGSYSGMVTPIPEKISRGYGGEFLLNYDVKAEHSNL